MVSGRLFDPGRGQGWNVPVHVPVCWTPPIVTVHGALVIETGGLAVGVGTAVGVGIAVGVGSADGEGEGDGMAVPNGVWLQMLTS